MKNQAIWATSVCVLASLLFLLKPPFAAASLVDWSKHEEWRRQQIQEILDEVKKSGSAHYTMLSLRDYDTNKDGKFDVTESKQLSALLTSAKPAKS